MRIVCDTNILISALLFPGGPPDELLNLVRLKELTLCLSPDILTEFKQVLLNKFKYTTEEAEDFLLRLTAISELVYPKERIDRIQRKKSDNRILECAVEAQAEYLVSGDKRDILPIKEIGTTKIVTAASFLDVWKNTKP